MTPLKIIIDDRKLGNGSSLPLILFNKDTNFSTRIIKENINTADLFYQINIYLLGDILEVIRSKYIPQSRSEKYYLKTRRVNFDFSEAIALNLQDLGVKILYKIDISLIHEVKDEYKFFNDLTETRTIYTSNSILFNPKYGEVTIDNLMSLHKQVFGKKIFSKSEKETVEIVNDAVTARGLENVLSKKDVKRLTFEGRNHGDIEGFKNAKFKFSKLMSEDRQKRVIYSANAILHFEEKFLNKVRSGENGTEENPFLKNEWFMGPLYSYNSNYKQYNN
jgi:hypothetical protein